MHEMEAEIVTATEMHETVTWAAVPESSCALLSAEWAFKLTPMAFVYAGRSMILFFLRVWGEGEARGEHKATR